MASSDTPGDQTPGSSRVRPAGPRPRPSPRTPRFRAVQYSYNDTGDHAIDWTTYDTAAANALPVTTFSQVLNRNHYSLSTDTCIWNGKQCIFKGPQRDSDAPNFVALKHEIIKREKLNVLIRRDGEFTDEQLEQEISLRYNVVPIHSVVIVPRPGTAVSFLVGLILPFSGDSLETIALRSLRPIIPVTKSHLRDLAHGVFALSQTNVKHGNINQHNVIFHRSPPTGPDDDGVKLMLVDLGDSRPPRYIDDALDLAAFFRWCLDRAPALNQNRFTMKQVRDAIAALKRGRFERAIERLS